MIQYKTANYNLSFSIDYLNNQSDADTVAVSASLVYADSDDLFKTNKQIGKCIDES
jgi:hypothetical protein